MRLANRKRPRRLAILTILVQSLAGCSQTQHRLNADREAYCTIAERNHDPRWAAADIGIDMDPRSRYFDPYNPDCSPMPSDDPASHRYMHCVDGKQGWKHWDRHGVRAGLENPQWRVRLAEYVELTDENAVELDVDSAVRLAYVHSPLHQQALETLYLTSLDVTGQRFRLDTQFFGGNGLAYRHQGNVSPATIGFNPFLRRYVATGPINTAETNRLTNLNDLEARRRFATAGEVLVGFANSFAFEFTGSDVNLASSLANFSFIQPLLRGAGRDVALEQLTLSERRLLANLRAYSQFRQGFFTQIVIGELGVTGPQRFGPDTVLQSFSGFGGVNGYLGLLQQSQQIRNTEENLRLQLRTLDRLEALYENELIDIVQVDQFRQNIEATRANLLDQTNGLELAIDNYKTQILGLPPDLPVDLDEQLIEQFQLIPTASASLLESLLDLQQRIGVIGELSDLQSRLEFLDQQLPDLPQQDLVDADLTLRRFNGLVESAGRRLRDLPNALDQLQDRHEPFFDDLDESERETLAKIRTLAREDMEQLSQQFLDATQRLDELLDNLSEDNLVATVAANSDWFSEILALSHAIVLIQSAANDLPSEPKRVLADAEQLIEPVRELFAVARADLERLEEVAADRERSMSEEEKLRFRRDREKLNERLDDLESGDAGLQISVDELNQLRDFYSLENRDQTIRGLTAWIQSYLQLVERLALVPAQARLEIIAVEQVELEPEAAFQIALQNRLDFMNGRAALVDRWRAIQVAADALQSDLSITGGGDVRTAKNNPVDFRAATSTLRLGIEFDAPLARLLERNGYRESLIEFQRNRRNLIQSEDSLQKGLRALLRTLRQRKLQLEIQRRAVTIALRRVDQTQLSLLTPPPQGQPGVRPQINPTTAINLLGAQGSLQTSQNSFLAAWLDYYAARLRLFRELGVMQLDSSGRWIENSVDFGADEPAGLPESLPPADPVDALELDVSDSFGELGIQANSPVDIPAIVIQPVGTDHLGTQWSARPVVASRQKTGKN
nr:TolC family protein [Rhodopirellula sp. SM50]